VCELREGGDVKKGEECEIGERGVMHVKQRVKNKVISEGGSDCL
jgi:hypothetical protein